MGTEPTFAHEPVAWADLRSDALVLAAAGWPLLPGTYQADGEPGWRGQAGADQLQPIADGATTDLERIAAWWTCEPYSILLGCGHGVDALEITAAAGTRILAPLRRAEVDVPAMITPARTVVLFVRSGTTLRPALARDSLVTARTAGSWLALPPTGAYRWRVHPREVRWQLPAADEVQGALEPVLRTLTQPPGSGRARRHAP